MILGVDAVAMITACGLGIGLAWLVAASSDTQEVQRMEKWENELDASIDSNESKLGETRSSL